MLLKSVPFVPLPLQRALKISRDFGLIGMGTRASKLFPHLTLYLFQCESEFEEREYTSIAIFASLFWLALLAIVFTVIYFIAKIPPNYFLITVPLSLVLSSLIFIYIMIYPRLIISRRTRDIEKNLLFAVRHLLIQVKSGVPLFDAMVSVSHANYGLVSEEFNNAIRKISTGIQDVDVLEELALKNPSLYFRRSLWQISNAIRSGADIANTLDNIVTSLANEQRVLVRKYGSQLNPLAFIYLMFGVIIPSLGIALMITLS